MTTANHINYEAATAAIQAATREVQAINAELEVEIIDLTNLIEVYDAQINMYEALQDTAIAHGMSSDIRVIKGEVTNFVIGDAA